MHWLFNVWPVGECQQIQKRIQIRNTVQHKATVIVEVYTESFQMITILRWLSIKYRIYHPSSSNCTDTVCVSHEIWWNKEMNKYAKRTFFFFFWIYNRDHCEAARRVNEGEGEIKPSPPVASFKQLHHHHHRVKHDQHDDNDHDVAHQYQQRWNIIFCRGWNQRSSARQLIPAWPVSLFSH